MPTTVQAIETHYRGYRFRSRLEARWAVALDHLGVEYEYEPEGYELPNGQRYLPDFYLPKEHTFLEIKGREPTEEDWDKAGHLAYCTQRFVNILSGNIGEHTLQYAKPKNHPTEELLRWLRNAPKQAPKARLISEFARHTYLPDDLLDLITYSYSNPEDRRPYLRRGAGGKAHMTTAGIIQKDTHYEVDYDMETERLALWRIYAWDRLAGTEIWEDSRYGFHIEKFLHNYEAFASLSPMDSFSNPTTYGSWPYGGNFKLSSKFKNAVRAARSARFEHGETPTPPRGGGIL